MTVRRVNIKDVLEDEGDKQVVSFDGVAGETDIPAEQYQIGGVAYCPADGESAESLMVEINNDPDNMVALPHGGTVKCEKGETILYQGDTRLILRTEGNVVELLIGGDSANYKRWKINY